MLDFDEIWEIRYMYFQLHKSIEEICRMFKRDYRTVKKYIETDDFNLPPPVVHIRQHIKLTKWIPTIDSWLTEDKTASRKQRHTSKRIYDRLKDDPEFDCSYSTVNRYVVEKKKELNLKVHELMIPLTHKPGTAQADFGDVMFMENGVRIEGHELVLSFPYSNAAFAVLTYGENKECLLEGLDTIFRFIGGVPKEIWFDNASSMVAEVIGGGGRKMTERFMRFSEHYRFLPKFMNVRSGNEKGNVESNVGTLRRNLFVPIPQFDDLAEYNRETLKKCMKLAEEKDHYKHGVKVITLFREDCQSLIPLPSIEFDLSTFTSYMTGETGLFKIDDYTYSSSPEYARKRVYVRISASEVKVVKEDMETVIAVHRRLYGNTHMESIQWGPYLRAMSYKPRAFLNSGLKDLLPDEMRIYLYNIRNSERGEILTIMADLYESNGFENVMKLCLRAAADQRFDSEYLLKLSRRMYGDKVFQSDEMPEDNDLRSYDELLRIGMKKRMKEE